MQIKSYTEAIEFIHGRRKFTKSPDLERMRRFAHYLGDPQKKTKFIHVTGTNGKGSTVALRSGPLLRLISRVLTNGSRLMVNRSVTRCWSNC